MITTSQQRRRHMGIIIVCAAAAATHIAAPVRADVFTFGGTVTWVQEPWSGFDPPWDGVSVGIPWEITYTFDNSAPDMAPGNPNLGSYNAISSYGLTIGTGTESASVDPASTFISVFSGQPAGWDQYEIWIPLGGQYQWFMQLDDGTGTAWALAGLDPRDALPLCGDIDLSWFDDVRDFTLWGYEGGEIWGSVDYFSCVPEPGSLTLLSLGGLTAALRRRR